ncbi:MAG: hypothetical protein ACRC33_15735 [Gemmataceae bacterium]
MRWTILGAVALLGCQQVPPAADPGGLGGGVIPASFTQRPAPAGDQPVHFPPQARRPRRESYPPPRPAAPDPVALGHAADYRWIVGVLGLDRGVWTICYGGSGDPDRYGASLELLDTGPMNGFGPGRLVRVEGELVDPAPLEVRPAYRARSLHVVGR